MSEDKAYSGLKFYTDKHIHKAVATQLRQRGVDVVRCEEVGMGDAKDHEHLEYALRENRVMITGDVDFLLIHDEWQRSGKSHAGIMRCQPHLQGPQGIGIIVKTVLMYHELIEGGAGKIEDDIANQIIYVG